MFRCQACGSTTFDLAINPKYAGQVTMETNEHDELVAVVQGNRFVLDLVMMNRCAVCRECEAIGQWEYYFPKNTAEYEDTNN